MLAPEPITMAVIEDQLLACSDATRGVELDLLVPLPPYFDHVEEEVRRGGGVIEISQEAATAGRLQAKGTLVCREPFPS